MSPTVHRTGVARVGLSFDPARIPGSPTLSEAFPFSVAIAVSRLIRVFPFGLSVRFRCGNARTKQLSVRSIHKATGGSPPELKDTAT